MPFYYDADGTRSAFKYNGVMYYYIYNLQGDVTHIVNADNTIVGTYQYDPYGRIINLTSLTAVAKANPFRYRGYYYDTESNMYYLNSRYYNPEFGRFINADSRLIISNNVIGMNLFAYCNNNPVIFKDEFGTRPNVSLSVADTGSYSLKVSNTSIGEKIAGKLQTVIDSVMITSADDIINSTVQWMQPASVLSSTNNEIVRALGVVSDTVGLASIVTCCLDLVWDYGTYKDNPDMFLTSVDITIAFTGIGLLAGAAIAICGFAAPEALLVSVGVGAILSLVEDDVRNKLLN